MAMKIINDLIEGSDDEDFVRRADQLNDLLKRPDDDIIIELRDLKNSMIHLQWLNKCSEYAVTSEIYSLQIFAGIKEAEEILKTLRSLSYKLSEIKPTSNFWIDKLFSCEEKRHSFINDIRPFSWIRSCNDFSESDWLPIKCDKNFFRELLPLVKGYVGRDVLNEGCYADIPSDLYSCMESLLMQIRKCADDILMTVDSHISKYSEIIFSQIFKVDDQKQLIEEILVQYNPSIKIARLEDMCEEMLHYVKTADFIKEASEDGIITEESQYAGITREEASFNHFFTIDEDDMLVCNKKAILKYIFIEGIALDIDMWASCQRYNCAKKLLKEIEEQEKKTNNRKLERREEYNEDAAVEDLKQYFFNDEEQTRKFTKKAKVAKDTEVVQELNMLLKIEHPNRIISINNMKKFHEVLYYNHLYDTGYSNFNTQIRR